MVRILNFNFVKLWVKGKGVVSYIDKWNGDFYLMFKNLIIFGVNNV